MEFVKRLWTWEKTQWQKPKTRLAVGVATGVLIGFGAENVGLGIVLGVALGAAGYKINKNNK